MKRAACIATALVVSTASAAASAEPHRIEGHVSRSGVDAIADIVPSLVPDQLTLPEVSESFSCLEAAQRDTQVEAEVHDVAMTMPRDGVLRVELELSVDAEGELFLNGCGLSTTCGDSLSLSHGEAAVEFQLEMSGGKPRLQVYDVELLVDEEDIDVALSDCALDDLANFVIGAAQSLALDLILDFIGDTAATQVAPVVEDLIAGFATFEGHFGPTDLQADLLDVHAASEGMFMSADVSIENTLEEPASCVQDDAEPPKTHQGLAPSLTEGTPAHLGMAVNLGLLDDVMYNVWRSGLMCLSDAHLAALGVDVELDYHAGKLLPGFPPDTDFSLEVRVMQPPRIEGYAADDAELTLVGRGIEADLIGRHSQGQDTIHVRADVEASARLAIDRDASALVLRPEGVRINRLELDDVVGGESLGVDTGRFVKVLESHIVPKMVDEIGAVPVTGSILGFQGHYMLLRDVFTTDGHLAAKVDLFSAPENDTSRPTTALESRPDGLVAAEDTVLRATGSDPEIPSELLRYRVEVDGEARPLSFSPEIPIGRAGESGHYRVSVSAVDLAGNEDPDPIVMDLDVDGVEPTVEIEGGGAQKRSGSRASIAWRQSDDITPSEELAPRVDVYRVRDPSDLLDVELVSEAELEPGATSHELDLQPGEVYRVEVAVGDEAGNEGVASAMVSTRSGGCAISAGSFGSRAGGPAVVILAWAAFALLRRRRDAASRAMRSR